MINDNNVTHLDKMIDNILNTKYEDLPDAAVSHAKNRLLDAIGCMICGANDVGNPELLEIIRDWGGKAEARVFVHGDSLPSPSAVMVNCIMARSFDFEPVSPVVDGQSIPGHISGTTTMTALTLGDIQNISGKELLAALLVGDDMATRVLLAGGTRMGFDHVGQANSFGATAIAGRLLGLNHEQLRNAFGLILDHLGGSQQMIGETTTGFKLSQGNSARDAVFCVRLAVAGWTGVRDALLAQGAYYSMYTDGIKDPDLLTKNLGKEYYSDGTFKPYPCCRMNHSAVDCAMAFVKEYGVVSNDIKEVILSISPGALHGIIGLPFRIMNSPHASAGFSVRYCVADVLVRGSSRPEHFTEEAIRDTAISDFLKKLTAVPLTEGNMESAGLKVIMNDGREFETFIETATGDPTKPISKEQLLEKYRINIQFSNTVSNEKADEIVRIVEDLENLKSVKQLVDCMIA